MVCICASTCTCISVCVWSMRMCNVCVYLIYVWGGDEGAIYKKKNHIKAQIVKPGCQVFP